MYGASGSQSLFSCGLPAAYSDEWGLTLRRNEGVTRRSHTTVVVENHTGAVCDWVCCFRIGFLIFDITEVSPQPQCVKSTGHRTQSIMREKQHVSVDASTTKNKSTIVLVCSTCLPTPVSIAPTRNTIPIIPIRDV